MSPEPKSSRAPGEPGEGGWVAAAHEIAADLELVEAERDAARAEAAGLRAELAANVGVSYSAMHATIRRLSAEIDEARSRLAAVEALRGLSDAATDGPWLSLGWQIGSEADEQAVADAIRDEPTGRDAADAAFIAAAANYVRAVLAAANSALTAMDRCDYAGVCVLAAGHPGPHDTVSLPEIPPEAITAVLHHLPWLSSADEDSIGLILAVAWPHLHASAMTTASPEVAP